MNKYVFITPSVSNMGGAQMYIRNKLLFLRHRGWDVDIVTAQKGELKLSELRNYQFVIPELAFEIFNFGNNRKKLVVDKIVKKIMLEHYEEIVIESTCISESSWAEAVAKRIGAKHLSYLLQEENKVNNRGMQDFFLFKLKRKELFGIVDTSLETMFSTFHPISKEESYRLPAYCNNVEADVDSPYIKQVENVEHDFVIGMLSRLEKPFVMPAITEFCSYAQQHFEKKYLFLLMGDAPRGSGILGKIQDFINTHTSNVNLVSTGYLYPVPTKLLEMCDAFFTSAGSSWVCMRSGVPTIAIDGNDFKPIGILGRTSQHSLFRGENEPPQDFSKLMDDILVEKKYTKQAPNYKDGLPDFSDHMKALEETATERKYYDVESIRPETKSDLKLRLALSIIGPKNYLRLGFLKEKWSRRK